MINLIEKLLNLIYTRPCYFCGSTKEDSILCSDCRKKINFISKRINTNILGVDVYSCTVYEDIIKKLIIELKYYNKKKLSLIQAQIMFDYIKNQNFNKNFIILPVPIHKNRLKERKYNHMDLTADHLSKLSGFKSNKNFIIRTKDTLKQFNLNKEERENNIKGAFELNKKFAPDKNSNLLIIDDIIATGTTLKEIIMLLKSNGYNNITALTFSTPNLKSVTNFYN